MSALALPLLAFFMGVVFDLGRAMAVRTKAQNAADAALLGAVATNSTTPVQGEFIRLFRANFPDNYMGIDDSQYQNVPVNCTQQVCRVDFPLDVNTIVLNKIPGIQGLLDKDKIKVQIIAETTGGFGDKTPAKLDLALVLDNTGSMADDNKMNGLKIAANSLVDILFGGSEEVSAINLSVVPYDTVVNIGPGLSNWMQNDPYPTHPAWSDRNPARGWYYPLDYETRDATAGEAINRINNSTSRQRYELFSTNLNKGFAGNRIMDGSCGPYAYVGIGSSGFSCRTPGVCTPQMCPGGQTCNPETLVCTPNPDYSCPVCTPPTDCDVPYSYPDAHRLSGYWCFPKGDATTDESDYFEDPPTTEQMRFRIPFHTLTEVSEGNGFYRPQAPYGWWQQDYNPIILDNQEWVSKLAPVLFASSNKTQIKNAIQSMQISGQTRIPVGLMWGGFTLSPLWRDTWAQRPGSPSGAPRDEQPHLIKALILMTDGINFMTEVPHGSNMVANRDNIKTEELCKRIKARGTKGVIIYTIAFGNISALNRDILLKCASKPNYYFEAPTNEVLNSAFKKIGDSLIYETLKLTE